MKPEDLKDWQKKFLDDLRKQDWEITEPVKEPEPSEEDKVREEIESAPDSEVLVARPKGKNPFKNVSVELLRSKNLNKQLLFLYKYKNLKRKGKLVGREGGAFKIKIEKYKEITVEELEEKYPIEEM